MTDKPLLIALHVVEAICPKCKRYFIECDYVKQRRNKYGKPIRHKIECDLCMEARIGPAAMAEYFRIKEQIKRVHPHLFDKEGNLLWPI